MRVDEDTTQREYNCTPCKQLSNYEITIDFRYQISIKELKIDYRKIKILG